MTRIPPTAALRPPTGVPAYADARPNVSREDLSRESGARESSAREDDGRENDGRRKRWTQHRVDRRQGFVQAGADAVDRWGPAASAEQIAAAAGVSRTVLYRYFRDREDLRTAIADHVVAAVIGSVMPQLQLTEDSTPEQIITSAVGTIIGWLDEHPNLYRFLRNRSGALDSVGNTLAATVAVLLQAIMAALGIEADVADPGAYGIVGFVEASGAWWLDNRAMPRERFTEVVSRGVWHLLAGFADEHGIALRYDRPLPLAALMGGTQP